MGRYVQSTLLGGEVVVHETKLHWITFISLRSLLTLCIAPLIDRCSSEFAITGKRLIIKTGLFARHTLEMNLTQVESINVDQNIPGRLFGYGTITVIGTGGTREQFRNISNPLEFRRQFQAQQP